MELIEYFVYAILLILGICLIIFGIALQRTSSSEDPRDLRMRAINQKFRAIHQRAFRHKNIRRHLMQWWPVIVGLFMLLLIIQVSSAWPFTVTLRHIAAAPNCDMARLVGLAPASRGEPGYYKRHDGDNDGISCEVYPR